jgi:hypothetical protein
VRLSPLGPKDLDGGEVTLRFGNQNVQFDLCGDLSGHELDCSGGP